MFTMFTMFTKCMTVHCKAVRSLNQVFEEQSGIDAAASVSAPSLKRLYFPVTANGNEIQEENVKAKI